MNRTDGFVLLQLLAGILILLALTIVLGPNLRHLAEIVAENRVEQDFEALCEALDMFYRDTGTYPATAPPDVDPGLAADFRALPGWDGPYLETWPVAPLGSRYRYVALPLENSDRLWVGLQYFGKDKVSWLEEGESAAEPGIPAVLKIVERKISKQGDDIFYLVAYLTPEVADTESRPVSESAPAPDSATSMEEATPAVDPVRDDAFSADSAWDDAQNESGSTGSTPTPDEKPGETPVDPFAGEDTTATPGLEPSDPWSSLITERPDENGGTRSTEEKPPGADSLENDRDRETPAPTDPSPVGLRL